MRYVKWYWFLAPESLLVYFFAAFGVGQIVMDWDRKAWLYPGIGYVIMSIVWYLFFVRRLGKEKAAPPLYFRLFLVAILCIEGAVFLFLPY